MKRLEPLRRVDLQVSLLTAVIVIISCTAVYFLSYSLTHADMIHSLQERVMSIHTLLEHDLDPNSFLEIQTVDDEEKTLYQETKSLLESVKNATGVRYLYTATRTVNGDYIYLVDGLLSGSEDFRHAGEPIEPEIIPDMEQALSGGAVLPDEIKSTSWGYIFISYLPVHHNDTVVGVLGIEFDASHQYKTYRLFRIVTPFVIIVACLLAGLVAAVLFRRISNPTFKDLATTDLLTGLRNRNAFEVAAGNLYRDRGAVALLAVDLDGLKKINDCQGHQAGDDYIQACAQALQTFIKTPDLLYRIGGDEFAAILLNKSESDMQNLVDQLNAPVKKHRPDSDTALSLSAGYAFFDRELDETLFSTLDRADAMMYDNKRKKNIARQ